MASTSLTTLKWLLLAVLLKAMRSRRCVAPNETGVSYIEPEFTYNPMEAAGFAEVSEAILTPFGRVVILVFPVST